MERAFHATSDFPALLVDAGQRVLVERFGAELTPLKLLSTMRNARDFRQQSFIRPGEAPKLEKVAENGEIKRGTLKEEKQGLQLEEYGRIFGLTRKALVNDDLGGFANFLLEFARASASTEGDLFYNLISANAFGGIK
ncbi:peptidase, partial [Rhizobiaceae sp. 2RAB30]